MNIIRRHAIVAGRRFSFFQPEDDDTVFGTLSCLIKNKFHLEEVEFKPGDVFVDLGCNVGLVSLAVALTNSQARVFSFDASPIAVGALRCAVAENAIVNLQAFQVAVGAENKKGVQFFSNGHESSCLVQEGFNSSNPVPAHLVNKVSIDTIFDSELLGIDRVRYLKLDIEGIEHEVFARLFNERPDILDRIDYLHVEIHPYSQFGPEALRQKLIQRFGDRVFFDT